MKKIVYLEDIINEWINNKKTLKLQSLLNYKMLINRYINSFFSYKLINSLTKEDIINFFNNLNIAISTKRKLLYILKSVIEYSYEKNYITEFINLKDIKISKSTNNIYILTHSEQKRLENYLKCKVNIRKVCLLLCLYTGLRVGEISGLKWQDIDFNKKFLWVKRTILRIKNDDNGTKTKLIVSTPKSESSIRIVPIPNFILDLLEVFRENNNNYILSKSSKLYDPRLFESFYERALIKCKIDHYKFHALRHTFATRSIESKMDIKTLSEILGHSSIEITLKLYVHPSYEMKKTSIENLVAFMSNN